MANEQGGEKIGELLRLCDGIPTALRADWDGSNHYDITNGSEGDFWWVCVPDVFDPRQNWCESEDGRRLGKLLDLATAAARLVPEVNAEMADLRAQLAAAQSTPAPDEVTKAVCELMERGHVRLAQLVSRLGVRLAAAEGERDKQWANAINSWFTGRREHPGHVLAPETVKDVISEAFRRGGGVREG